MVVWTWTKVRREERCTWKMSFGIRATPVMVASLSGGAVVRAEEVVVAVMNDVDDTVTVEVDSCSPKATEEMLERTCLLDRKEA